MEDKNPTIQISEMDFQTAQHNFFFFFFFFTWTLTLLWCSLIEKYVHSETEIHNCAIPSTQYNLNLRISHLAEAAALWQSVKTHNSTF